MASRRSSAAGGDAATGDGAYEQQQQQQRRGGARFARVLVEPARAAALLARSPVNPDAVAPPTRPGAAHPHHHAHQRSTPQPVRRTLFSRLFRMKARDADERGVSVSAAASPSSHQSTPTHHHLEGTDADHAAGNASTMTAATSAHSLIGHSSDDRLHIPGFARAVSLPYNNGKPKAKSHSADAADASPASEHEESAAAAPVTRILLEGALVKLSSHKYWHAKATFFVLEEATTDSEARSRVWLKQFRKQKKTAASGDDEPPIMEIELTEFDVVVDISDRYIKHGLELFHRSPAVKSPSDHHAPSDSVTLPQGDLQSLRLSVDDAAMHRKWMRVLGSAVARLIDQSKRHYPITPADVEFARGTLKAFEPQAVTAIVGTSIPVKGTAKVRPIINSSSSSSEEDDDSVHENQGEILVVDDGDCERASEVRDPEEPETHSDNDEVEPERASLSVVSDSFSDSWVSPHHNNNNSHGPDYDNNNERSSNQFEDQEDDDQQLQAHSRRLSECYSPSDYVDVAVATSNLAQASPTGTASVASTPSPQSGHGIGTPDIQEEAEVEHVAAAMAAASLAAEDAVMTPPTTPPSSSNKPLYARHHPLATTSRLGSVVRPQVHSFNANGQVFTLDVRYQLLKSIGNGAYGAVIAASDAVADMSVAVKKITNIFDDLVDAKRILREVRLLRHFHHKNITQLLDLAPPMAKKSFEDMYIITELMETDLHQVIYSMQPMSDDHVKYFLYQMLCALYHIHSAGVLHRDMKPSNILLNSNCDLKVCDFGLARGGMDANADARKLGQPGELTEYVVTRWYRAPEIMLNCLQYTAAIDIWAVGCIFAEMLLREPLFPGNDYMHQLKLIIKFLGTPKQEDIGFVKNVKALRFLTKLSISKPKKWREVFTGEDLNPLALDLLAQMLIFNPEKRISVEQALQHPYLSTFYDPADITRAPPFSFSFDLPDDKLTKEALVDLLCEDVECFHPALMRSMKQPPPPQMPMPMLPRPPMVATANGGNRYFGTTASAS